ncbi:MAG: hypothetical protein HYR49_07160 [Gammaproteobacteria bacterium]|nr:hypothetical protein [Gammaproteobacteria bacterium]
MGSVINRGTLRLVAFIAGVFLADPVLAATCTSNVAPNGNWSASGSWSACGGGIPQNGDDVVIAANDTIILDVTTNDLDDFTINASGILRGDNTGKILQLGGGGGEDFTNDGTLDFGPGNLATVRLSGGNSRWGGAGTWNLSVLDIVARTLTFSAGTTATLNFSGDAAPILFTTGIVTSRSTITWNFAGSVAQTLPTSTNVKYGAIATNNSAGVTLGVALSATSLLDNLGVQSGIFNDGGFAIVGNTGKTFSVSSDATFNLTNAAGMVTGFSTKTFGATSTVNYALNGDQPVSAETYGHLTLSGGGNKTPAAGTTTIAGDFTLAAGVTYAGTTNNPTVNLAGNLSNSGTFNSGTGTFTFNGSAAQSVTGATTFTNMTLDNGSGLTLNNDVTANTLLTFTNGTITTGANKMIIDTAGSHTGSSSARYVIGTMEKVGPVATFTFAVGDASNYTPVLTAFSGGGASGSLAVNTTAGEHPNIGTSTLDSTRSVNRYWTLTSTGLTGTYDATITFISPGDVDSASDFSSYTIQRFSGGSWFTTTTGAQNNTDTSATGLTGFGDFAVAVPLSGVNHYLISHDGSMVTCLTEDIIFTAHNAGHIAVNPSSGNVLSVSTSTGRGTWTLAPLGGTGTFTDATPNDGSATYQFLGGEPAVTLRLSYTNPATDPEAVNFNVSDNNGKTEATGTAAGDSDDADLGVSKTGFVFYNSTDSNTTFPTQIAGKRSDQGFGAKNLALRAVKVSDSDPSVCSTLFANGSDVIVELGAECRNPVACAGQQVSVTNNGNTSALSTNDDNGGVLTTGFTPVTLRFAASSTAELHVSYPDAGQMQLHARFDLGDPVGTFMTGSSNDFVVQPFGFLVTATGNPAAADETGTVYKSADDDFTSTIKAIGWQSADDANNDGIPDGHEAADTDPTNNADLSDNAALPNFGQESGGGEDVALTAALEQPAGGADPGLSGGTSVTSFTAGAGSTATARYAEVGIIEISTVISDGDYLGIGAAATALARGKSGRVGRFRPFEFTVTGNTPAFTPACNADTTDFTYLDQPFNYATAAQVTITAKSKLGATTTNYDSAWWKLANFSATYAHDGGALPGGVTLDSAAASHAAVDCSGGVCDGVFTSTFAGPFMYSRTVTLTAPFAAAVDITLSSITDSDGVTYAGNPFKFENIVFTGGANQQRWGRLAISESVGDPALTVDVPVTAEYYDGAAFVQNADDDCSAFDLANDVSLTNEASGTQDGDQSMTIGGGTTSVTSGNGLMGNGSDLMTFSAPGSGNTGLVDIAVDLDTATGADLPWLFFDWDGDGIFDTTTSGRASFGIISGPQSIIYSREPW